MTKERIIIESMASDLKRVCLGLERKSDKMAERFLAEAEKRRNEAVSIALPNYIKDILDKVSFLRNNIHQSRAAEDCLMYSVLLQNFARRK
ncbi:hypothetical protein GW918_02740 [Candidatus Berkelbacteria bacterium]|uniref:PhoU domain-containing protein n=1 Tax=Candidatus Berkelbacteria bacterium CG03_land_8_20_14_0_80_40_36 TaxID=1974509 RepID=A0A2M7CHK9_9BACT|nr:hypothetical protein [Candidatus Berkelbacteria bacterium]PIR28192.1 MAG: hypothetical protein COV39_00410 [Candidatus Berkelbacteria bacterium CG11_big_fil_rev_8_21_14_0_20_40_23]PIV25119.1 MAG: hypothetical protein COS38_03260 [Candidatus Berkelbacteria bacterium CG03_land_8_20_14_0_80_40_36]